MGKNSPNSRLETGENLFNVPGGRFEKLKLKEIITVKDFDLSDFGGSVKHVIRLH